MRIGQLLMVAWVTVVPSLALAQFGEPPKPPCDPDAQTCGVPEPETLALLGAGAVALFIARRRNKK